MLERIGRQVGGRARPFPVPVRPPHLAAGRVQPGQRRGERVLLGAVPHQRRYDDGGGVGGQTGRDQRREHGVRADLDIGGHPGLVQRGDGRAEPDRGA